MFHYIMMEEGITPIEYMREHPECLVAGVSAQNAYETDIMLVSGNRRVLLAEDTEINADTFTEDVSEVFHAGMNGQIEKPIDTALIYNILQKLVEEKGSLQSNS